jgi:putative transposase
MKRSRFNEEQIIAILREQEAGARLKALEDENAKLKKLLAEAIHDNAMLRDQADDRLLSEPAGIPGIPIAFHLPPHAAHRIFADRAAKDGREGPPHPTRIGPGKIGAGNQRIGLFGMPAAGSPRRPGGGEQRPRV